MIRSFSLLCVVSFTGAVFHASPAAAESVEYLSGKFVPCKKKNFVKVRGGMCLREEAYEKFKEMAVAAREAGIQLSIQSAARNFWYQKGIWERRWKARAKIKDLKKRALDILELSSMPGTSRHHWGTDVDLGHRNCGGDCLDNKGWSSGKGLEAYEWLTINAATYGFCQPFKESPSTRNGGTYAHGYNEERWHWSYKPLSKGFLVDYKSNIAALAPVAASFKGAEAGVSLYADFVQNVDQSCQ